MIDYLYYNVTSIKIGLSAFSGSMLIVFMISYVATITIASAENLQLPRLWHQIALTCMVLCTLGLLITLLLPNQAYFYHLLQNAS